MAKKVAAAPAVVEAPAGVEIVLQGYLPAKQLGQQLREFAQVITVPQALNSRTYSTDERVYEYIGDDETGRRIYRDHTRT